MINFLVNGDGEVAGVAIELTHMNLLFSGIAASYSVWLPRACQTGN